MSSSGASVASAARRTASSRSEPIMPSCRRKRVGKFLGAFSGFDAGTAEFVDISCAMTDSNGNKSSAPKTQIEIKAHEKSWAMKSKSAVRKGAPNTMFERFASTRSFGKRFARPHRSPFGAASAPFDCVSQVVGCRSDKRLSETLDAESSIQRAFKNASQVDKNFCRP